MSSSGCLALHGVNPNQEKRYQNFTEGTKEKKGQCYRKRNKILSKEQKQKLTGHRRNFYITHNK